MSPPPAAASLGLADGVAALATPLAIVGLGATGASGLSARALAAAVWSSLACFELYADGDLGLGDALRVSPCPLFDAATPPRERLGEMLQRVRTALAGSLRHPTEPPVYLVGPNAHERPALPADWAARLMPAPARSWAGGAGRWAEALIDAGRVLAAAPSDELALVAGADTLLGTDTLRALLSSGRLSTEHHAEGTIPGEAVAALALCVPRNAAALGLQIMATLLGACCVPFAAGAAAPALVQAVRSALARSAGGPVHTVLWDIADPNDHLAPMAEAIAGLTPLVRQATLSRPFMQLGYLGAAFGPVAAVLAVEGARAGVTTGGRSLIITLDDTQATAVLIDAPWQPQIMLRDASGL